MADKSKMKCNVVTKSDRAGEKENGKKLVREDKKNLFISELLVMVITIVVPQENLSELDTSAAKQNQNLQHAIGRAKLSGPDQGINQKFTQK